MADKQRAAGCRGWAAEWPAVRSARSVRTASVRGEPDKATTGAMDTKRWRVGGGYNAWNIQKQGSRFSHKHTRIYTRDNHTDRQTAR